MCVIISLKVLLQLLEIILKEHLYHHLGRIFSPPFHEIPFIIAASSSILFLYCKFVRVLCGEQKEPDRAALFGDKILNNATPPPPPILLILTLEQKLQNQDLQQQEDFKTSSHQL